jgi:hypothetical protein
MSLVALQQTRAVSMVRVYGKQELLDKESLGVIGNVWLKFLEMQSVAILFGTRYQLTEHGSHR